MDSHSNESTQWNVDFKYVNRIDALLSMVGLHTLLHNYAEWQSHLELIQDEIFPMLTTTEDKELRKLEKISFGLVNKYSNSNGIYNNRIITGGPMILALREFGRRLRWLLKKHGITLSTKGDPGSAILG